MAGMHGGHFVQTLLVIWIYVLLTMKRHEYAIDGVSPS